jgi:serine/threonine protein kinase
MTSICILINNTYALGKKLGNGSFGEVYQGKDKNTKSSVAIKLEPVSNTNPILQHEFNVYNEVYQTNRGIPRIYYYGIEDEYRVLVMDLLGPSLEDLFNLCKRKFSLKTTLMLADQLISRIEYLHSKYYIHRDIKPENFLVGLGQYSNKIYMIDFGLAKKYRSAKKHINYKEGNKLVGTARYASINSHKGIQLSRRDDMESIGYLLIYFLNGKLPWQMIKQTGDKYEKYKAIQEVKESTSIETLCAGLPKEFLLYFQHIKSIEFIEKPNYMYLKNLFQVLFKENKFVYDLEFDWNSKTASNN